MDKNLLIAAVMFFSTATSVYFGNMTYQRLKEGTVPFNLALFLFGSHIVLGTCTFILGFYRLIGKPF